MPRATRWTSRTPIIMTSNLGTHSLRKASLGFAPSDDAVTYERMKEKVMAELKHSFRPEFLNRIDEVIVFRELSRANVKDIVDLMMKRVRDQLESQDVGIELTDSAKDVLAEQGYDPALGARPLRRAIQRLVEDPVSEKILWKEFSAGQTIVVDTEPDPEKEGKRRIVFRATERAPETPPVDLADSATDAV